jgi:hypothetical protein
MNQDISFLPKYIYTYQHVDELAFVHSPAQVQADIYGAEGIVDLVPSIASLFRNEGWEGDGKIGLIWIPPFIMDDRGTAGVFVWFVKQGNNGTAFIGSSIPLPFRPIQEQN